MQPHVTGCDSSSRRGSRTIAAPHALGTAAYLRSTPPQVSRTLEELQLPLECEKGETWGRRLAIAKKGGGVSSRPRPFRRPLTHPTPPPNHPGLLHTHASSTPPTPPPHHPRLHHHASATLDTSRPLGDFRSRRCTSARRNRLAPTRPTRAWASSMSTSPPRHNSRPRQANCGGSTGLSRSRRSCHRSNASSASLLSRPRYGRAPDAACYS